MRLWLLSWRFVTKNDHLLSYRHNHFWTDDDVFQRGWCVIMMDLTSGTSISQCSKSNWWGLQNCCAMPSLIHWMAETMPHQHKHFVVFQSEQYVVMTYLISFSWCSERNWWRLLICYALPSPGHQVLSVRLAKTRRHPHWCFTVFLYIHISTLFLPSSSDEYSTCSFVEYTLSGGNTSFSFIAKYSHNFENKLMFLFFSSFLLLFLLTWMTCRIQLSDRSDLLELLWNVKL